MSDEIAGARYTAGDREGFVSLGSDRRQLSAAFGAGPGESAEVELPKGNDVRSWLFENGKRLLVLRFPPSMVGPAVSAAMRMLSQAVEHLEVEGVAIMPLQAGADVESVDQLAMNDLGWFRRDQFPERAKPLTDDDVEPIATALTAATTLSPVHYETARDMCAETVIAALDRAGFTITRKEV